MSDYDVVIAGFGPTCAVAANLLGAAGMRTLVVEPSLTIFDIPRAVHFDGEVMRTFQALDLHTQISEVTAPGVALGFTNGRNWNLFEQDLSILPRSQGWDNSNFFNQPALEAHLRAGLDRYASVTCCLGERVSGLKQARDHVVLDITHSQGDDATSRQVSTKYLLGCDGASSTIRSALAINQQDLNCDEPWLVVEALRRLLELDHRRRLAVDVARQLMVGLPHHHRVASDSLATRAARGTDRSDGNNSRAGEDRSMSTARAASAMTGGTGSERPGGGRTRKLFLCVGASNAIDRLGFGTLLVAKRGKCNLIDVIRNQQAPNETSWRR